jgi:heterodisulfide reductase subunit A
MCVKTDTEKVVRARKIVTELLLARSPESEVLLGIAGQLGIKRSRFPEREDDCILCGLCVRMCEERMGKSAISFSHRGIERIVAPPFGRKTEACQTCGACESICPVNCIDIKEYSKNKPVPILSGFDAELGGSSPAYIPFPQAVPKVATIDKNTCAHLLNGTCGICKEICEAGAIDYEQKEEKIDVEVGSVILTPGFEEFTAEKKGEYGHNRYPNVYTSVQFERMLSAAGPCEGHVIRKSDGREAKRIAWIQCVGSRDSSCGNEYCSSICCMASTKQALVANEHLGSLEASIFYIDIRAHGKDFDQYYERANAMDNICYIRSIPSRIIQMPGTMDLRLCYVSEKEGYTEQEYDIVVLSVGMDPKTTVSENIFRLGIELNEFGFCATDRLHPLTTSKPGVFVAGAFQEPKDIPETVMQASAAVSMSMELLSSARNSMITSKEYPPEHDVTDEEARIGVFVCHCGINIASVVDVLRVVEEVKKQPGVVMVTHTMFTCSDASLSEIREMITEHRLNRIVVASCTPRTHEELFRETLKESGLNPYLFELANIRDQCSWVHYAVPGDATDKAIELVKMSIARARNLVPLGGESIPINQSACVIGGGVSGMTAALSLANQGFAVNLVECKPMLAGNLININSTLEQESLDNFRTGLIDSVKNNPNVNLFLESKVTSVKGHVGNFSVVLTKNEIETEIQCGAIIVATGATPAKTGEYQYGKAENVLTQVEFEKRLSDTGFEDNDRNIVMIQCVGSRNDDTPYCSRICCSMAIKNALKVKKLNPTSNVYVLYRDIRTYGFRELYYKEARQAGVVFIHYDRDNLPVVSESDGQVNKISVESPDFSDIVAIETDLLVLSTGIQAEKGNAALSNMLKVPLNDNGFYVEAHLKLRPVDFATEGIFLCGLAHSPKFIDENISQAKAAAARAATILSKTHREVGAQVSRVNQEMCISCMTCVKACPYGAPFFNADNKAEVAGVKCMGCGICASECPAMAIQLNHFHSDHFNTMIKELSLSTDRNPARKE